MALKVKTPLYMGKYFLAFYNEEDELVAVFDGPADMAEALGVSVRDARSIISHLRHGKHQTTSVRGQQCKLYLMEDKDDDEE